MWAAREADAERASGRSESSFVALRGGDPTWGRLPALPTMPLPRTCHERPRSDDCRTGSHRCPCPRRTGDYEAKGARRAMTAPRRPSAWAIMEPTRNRTLAELAVKTTGLGNVPDKITKNHRKTLGLMRDIQDVQDLWRHPRRCRNGHHRNRPSDGRGRGHRALDQTRQRRPANNIINALKCGNAIVLSRRRPRASQVAKRLLAYIHAEFAKIGEDPDLVQMVPAPGSKEKTQRLMETCDMIVVRPAARTTSIAPRPPARLPWRSVRAMSP